jgi:hypothetical protein
MERDERVHMNANDDKMTDLLQENTAEQTQEHVTEHAA